MECTHPGKVHVAIKQLLDTRLHFARGLVRKGHRQNAVGFYAMLRHKVCNLVGNATSLSRTGPRQNKHRTINLLRSSGLLRVQFTIQNNIIYNVCHQKLLQHKQTKKQQGRSCG